MLPGFTKVIRKDYSLWKCKNIQMWKNHIWSHFVSHGHIYLYCGTEERCDIDVSLIWLFVSYNSCRMTTYSFVYMFYLLCRYNLCRGEENNIWTVNPTQIQWTLLILICFSFCWYRASTAWNCSVCVCLWVMTCTVLWLHTYCVL